MEFTAKQREILQAGILGTYPEEDELEIFLDLKMDIKFSEIAQGKMYKRKVFYLIRDFIGEVRLVEFISSVLTDKPRSPYLKNVIGAFKDTLIQSLIERNILKFNLEKSYTTLSIAKMFSLARIIEDNEISNYNLEFKHGQLLKTLEKIDFKLIQEIYRDSLPKNPSIDIDELMDFVTLETLIQILIIEFPLNQEKKPTILGFAFKLAKRLSDNNSKQELRQWINDVMEHNNLTFEVPNLETVEITTSDETLCYFLQIIVEPLPINSEEDRFILKALLIEYRNQEKPSEISVNTDWPQEEDSEQNGFCFRDVHTKINKIIESTSEKYLPSKAFDLFIEVFLTIPYLSEALDLKKISNGRVRSKRLGKKHPLIVRSYERAKNKIYKSDLKKKWSLLRDKIQANPNSKAWEEEFEAPPALAKKKWDDLEKHLNEKVGLKICSDFPTSAKAQRELFEIIVESGVPICLWSRKKSLEEDEMVKFNQLLSLEKVRDINNLYQAIFELRKEVPSSKTQAKNYLGSHLGFLCDHGERIPDISRLTRMV
jgi:hypothetical protein